MSATEARTSHLVRLDIKRGTTYVQVLRLDLDREMQERVGSALGIISAETKGRKGEALAAHLEDAFTRGVTEAVRKLPADAPQDQIFEAAISRTNHALNRLFGEYGLDVEPEQVSATIVAIKGHDMVAATWGSPTVLLYHPLSNGKAKTLDLVDDGQAEPSSFKTANARRCFGSIVAGRMGKNDRLLIASQDLRMFLGDDALCGAVLEHAPTEATEVLGKMLSPRAESMTIALVVLDVADIRYIEHELAETAQIKTIPSSKTSASIAQLLKTQSETGKTLTPSLISGISKKVGGLFQRENASATKQEKEKAKEELAAAVRAEPEAVPLYANVRQNSHVPDRTVVGTALAGLTALGKWIFAALRATASFAMAMSSKDKRQAQIQATKEKTDTFFNGLVDRYNAFSKPSKALFFVALSLIIVARGGIVVAAANRAKDERLVTNERAISSVQQKIDSAEASMVYRDENRARELLTEATAAIAALPGKTHADLATRDSLSKKVATTYDDLRHEVKLGQPDIVSSISTGAGSANLEKILFAGNALWSVSDKGEIYQISLKDGSAKKVADAPGNATPAVFLARGTDAFAASATGASTAITLAGKTAQGTIDFQSAQSSPADAEFYNSSLYVLDPTHNRITRHTTTPQGFSKPQFYLKDGTDLSTAVSLSIDGSVYVLHKDGTISRIVRGLQDQYGTSPVEPAMTAPLRLRTTAAADLYVLDGSPARIVRFNKKSGILVAQYTNDALKGATDFAIDDKGANAYVIKGNQILRFTLPDAKP